jgi:uncharacterized protein YcbK (DUF882 family)
MRRTTVVGAALLLLVATGTTPAVADEEEGAVPENPQAEASAAAAVAGNQATGDGAEQPRSKRSRRSRRSRRREQVSGRVVPEDQLRQDPLPKPSGDLHLVGVNLGDEAEVNIYNEDGSYNLDALEQVNHVLRCRRTDSEKPIDPGLLTLLSHVYDHFGGKPLEIVSGYRNQRKKTSNHYKGTASDIRISGVSPKKIRAFAETLDTGGMGIGLYPRSGFVHIDVRPAPSYRWIDYSPPNPNAAEKRPPRGWKRKKLQS